MNGGCLLCGGPADYVCEGCDVASYCSELCQELDLPVHTKECHVDTTIDRHSGGRGGGGGGGHHLSRSKAWELIHNPPHNRALTPRQLRYFWSVYHNKSYESFALNLNEPIRNVQLKMPLSWSPALGVRSKEYKQYVANSIIRDELIGQLSPGQYIVSLAIKTGSLSLTILTRAGRLIQHTLTPESRGPLPTLNSWRVESIGLVPGDLSSAISWVSMKERLGRLIPLPLNEDQDWRSDRFARTFPRRHKIRSCIRPEPFGIISAETLWDASAELEPVVLEVTKLEPCLQASMWSRMKSGLSEGETTCSPAEVLAEPEKFENQWNRIAQANLGVPIIVCQTEDGAVDVLDGLYRLAHAYLIGVPTIQAKIVSRETLVAMPKGE